MSHDRNDPSTSPPARRCQIRTSLLFRLSSRLVLPAHGCRCGCRYGWWVKFTRSSTHRAHAVISAESFMWWPMIPTVAHDMVTHVLGTKAVTKASAAWTCTTIAMQLKSRCRSTAYAAATTGTAAPAAQLSCSSNTSNSDSWEVEGFAQKLHVRKDTHTDSTNYNHSDQSRSLQVIEPCNRFKLWCIFLSCAS
jgi:hypothetical protein